MGPCLGDTPWAGSGLLDAPGSVWAGRLPFLSLRPLPANGLWDHPLPGSGADRNRGGDSETPGPGWAGCGSTFMEPKHRRKPGTGFLRGGESRPGSQEPLGVTGCQESQSLSHRGLNGRQTGQVPRDCAGRRDRSSGDKGETERQIPGTQTEGAGREGLAQGTGGEGEKAGSRDLGGPETGRGAQPLPLLF